MENEFINHRARPKSLLGLPLKGTVCYASDGRLEMLNAKVPIAFYTSEGNHSIPFITRMA